MSHEKCHCKHYEGEDHRSPLIKLDIPEYEDYPYGNFSSTCCKIIRMISYFTVITLLFYSLWRIQAIESRIEANDNWANLTRILKGNKRATRSIQDQILMNSFGDEKGMMSNTAWKKPTNKGEFDELVNDLFDKIKAMHDDEDRGHFDRNMKAVFQAWFPVFDALLPKELKEDGEIRKTRDVQEYFYRPKRGDKSSEENSDESDKKDSGLKKKDDSVSSDESDEKDSKKENNVVTV